MATIRKQQENAISTKDYEQLKRRLVKQGALAGGFLGGTFGGALREPLKSLKKMESPYEPLLYETWLRELAESLDRLLVFRREARELEVAAVKVAAEYDLFCHQSRIDCDLEISRLRSSTKRSVRESQVVVSNAFKGKDSSLAPGFEKSASGSVQDIEVDLRACDDEIKLLQDKQLLAQDYQDAFFARTKEDGNAHNYYQQSAILWKLIVDELTDAYLRSVAIAAGIKEVYGRNIIVPDSSSPHLIDELVFWCRTVIRAQAITIQAETEFDIVIPLVQAISGTGIGLVSANNFAKAIAGAQAAAPVVLTFTIPRDSFGGMDVRVRRIGASYGNRVKVLDSGADRNATTDSYARYRMSLVTPLQGKLNKSYRRPEVKLGLVSLYGGQAALCYSDGLECVNLDPVGEWSISIEPYPSYKDDVRHTIDKGIANEPMLDIKLHLRLRTINQFEMT